MWAQETATKGKTIIVFDASGSMWGKVSGGVKIDIAKKAIVELLPTIGDGEEIGLIAYGHRKKGDCSDIELLVPPAAGNRAAILRAVEGIVPKGKTPLCDAVLMAADSLRFEESKATVILISDGIETCGKDPCEVGAQLEAKGIDFVCHVVAFDISRDKNAGLDCLANKTGGLYLEAKDAASLKSALNQVVKAAVKKPVMKEKTYLVLRGKDGAGKMLTKGVEFAIYKGDEVKGAPVYKGSGGEFKTELAAGEYTVTGQFGEMKAESTLQIPEGKTGVHEMLFKAVGLKLRVLMVEGEEPLEKGLSWKVYREGSDRSSKPHDSSYNAEPLFDLEPGKYVVWVAYEESTAEKTVEMIEGKANELTLVLGSGTLLPSAKMDEKSDVLKKDLSWTLYHAERDSEGDLRKAAHSYNAQPNLVVAGGKYLLQVKYGDSSTKKEIEVKAGEKTEVLLTFGSGTLEAKAFFVDGGEQVEKDLSWTLYGQVDGEGERKKVSHTYGAVTGFKVPAGMYLLSLKRGQAKVEKEVEVLSGEKTVIQVSLNAGIWKGEVVMSEASEVVSKGTSWTVYSQADSEGERHKVNHSYGNPTFTMTAGRYLVVVKRGAAKVEQEIEVVAAKVTSDRFVLNAGTVALTGEGKKAASVRVDSIKGDEREKVVRDYGNKLKYYLPAGDYVAVFSRKVGDEKKVTETSFTVEAGKFLEVELK